MFLASEDEDEQMWLKQIAASHVLAVPCIPTV
jgi:hypothetical protein